MAIQQVIQDGKLVDTSASATSLSTTSDSDGTSLDKDAFLQLLVAQMKYQDPLEPTDNTEYVSQLATFSQLEATTNMQVSMEQSNANALVGKDVIIKVTSSVTGETSYVSGPVDYVVYEGDKTYLSVNDSLYSLDDLDTVADSDYMTAVTMSKTFKNLVTALPTTSELKISDESKITSVREIYDAMTSYQKGYIGESDLTTLTTLETKLTELKAAAATTGSKDSTDSTSNNTTEATE